MSEESGKKKTSVYCPTSVAITERFRNAPRISSFEGKRVGLLWNGKSNGDFLLKRVGELLENRYGKVKITRFWEVDPRAAHPDKKTDAELDNIARSSDIVISAAGD